MNFYTKILKQDNFITLIILILSLLSCLLIYSTTINSKISWQGPDTVYKQLIFVFLGIITYFGISIVNFIWLKQKTVVSLIYIIISISLIYLLVFGEVVQNTLRWIDLGFFSFQPSEFAKLAIIITTSYIITNNLDTIEYNNLDNDSKKYFLFKNILLSLFTVIPFFILIALQPSLGNAVILGIIYVFIVFLAFPTSKNFIINIILILLFVMGFNKIGFFETIYKNNYLSLDIWRLFWGFIIMIYSILGRYFKYLSIFNIIIIVILTFLVMPGLEFSWNNLLKDYQRDRIISYSSGFSNDPTNNDYQIRSSLRAIGSGQLTGVGYLNGAQSNLNNLPFAHTDFIFAAHSEQFGYIGAVILLLIYTILIYRISLVFIAQKKAFPKLLIGGIIALLTSNIIINVLMNIGLAPITGVPLPLLSYGGTSVLLTMISLGIVQSIKIHQPSEDYASKLIKL